MKEEALKLAKYLDRLNGYMDMPRDILDITQPSSAMIRRLVEELDKQTYKADLLENRLKVIVGSKPTITKADGKVVAVTMTDDEHRVHEILWEAPKPLSDDEILEILIDKGICGRLKDGSLCYWQADADLHDFARAIEERHGIK